MRPCRNSAWHSSLLVDSACCSMEFVFITEFHFVIGVRSFQSAERQFWMLCVHWIGVHGRSSLLASEIFLVVLVVLSLLSSFISPDRGDAIHKNIHTSSTVVWNGFRGAVNTERNDNVHTCGFQAEAFAIAFARSYLGRCAHSATQQRTRSLPFPQLFACSFVLQ